MKMLTEQRLRELLEKAYWEGAAKFAYPYLSGLDKANPQAQSAAKQVVDNLVYISDRE
jgi:hypothetical protein